MENPTELLFGETKIVLPGASSSKKGPSKNNVQSSSSSTTRSLCSSESGVPNSFYDAILTPSSFDSNLPPLFSTVIAPPRSSNASSKLQVMKSTSLVELVELFYDSESREDAIACLKEKAKCTHETCKFKTCQQLAALLWNGFGITNVLLQELLAVYTKLSPMTVTTRESNRVCNVLALFQVMAAHPDVKMRLVRASLPVYLYPLISTAGDDIPIKHMKLASLGVIGALVKCEEPTAGTVVHFLLDSEMYPLCLSCMDNGDSLAKEVATFILLKILMQEEGLKYCCNFADRFLSTVQALGRQVNQIAQERDERWLKYVMRCYVRLSESQSSIDVLKHHFPPKLRDNTFSSIFHCNPDITRLLQQVFCNMTVGLRPIVPKGKVDVKGPKANEIEVSGTKSTEVEPQVSKPKEAKATGKKPSETDPKGPKIKEAVVNKAKPDEVVPKGPKPKEAETSGAKAKEVVSSSSKPKETGPKGKIAKGKGPRNNKPKA